VVAARPGGSMLNTAVSLGRAGIRVEFVGDIACDEPGDRIEAFLRENKVGTSYAHRPTRGKTTLALAFLNEHADASYSFYSDFQEERLAGKLPVPSRGDVVLFGSSFSLADGIHERLCTFLDRASRNNALVVYDPNFRKPHLQDLPRHLPRIEKNLSFADIVRGSDEDFLFIFALRDPREIHEKIRTENGPVLIVTRSGEAVGIVTGEQTISVPVPPIGPVSTIGAGDSFNAGLIHAFITKGLTRDRIPGITAGEWKEITGNAVLFAQNVCMSFDNYISLDLLNSPEK
jgi:fructokinase